MVRNIIEPKIIGKQVGLPPIVTLMAMYLGLNTVGLLGMICFPIMIIIVAKLQEAGLIHIWKSVKAEELSEENGGGSDDRDSPTDGSDPLPSDAAEKADLQNNKETVV